MARKSFVHVRVTEQERHEMEREAQVHRLSVGTWLRAEGLKAAERGRAERVKGSRKERAT